MKKWVAMLLAGVLSVAWSIIAFAEEADVKLQEVVVTATKTEKDPKDVTQAVTVITSDEIKRSGASNAAEVVKKSVDLNFQEYGPKGSTANISVRGSTAAQVLILLDGIRLNSPGDGGFNLTDLPVALDDIERIEIVRGPSSALYGADAVGGVVNIITKKPEKDQTRVTGTVGSHGYDSVSASNAGKADKMYYTVTAGRETSDGYRRNSDLDQKTVGGKIGYEITQDASLDLTANYIGKEIGVPGSTDWLTPFARQWTRALVTGLGYRAKLSKELDMKLNADYHRDMLSFRRDLTSAVSKHESETSGADAQINWLANLWNAISVGTEARKDHVKSTDSGDHDTRLLAGYLQDEVSIGEPLILVLGGRYDSHSVYGGQFSPKASARYLIAYTGTIVRASAGKSYRAPTLNDLYWSDPFMPGNPNLRPETAKEYEVGVEQKVGKEGVVKLTGFERQVKDLINWHPDAMGTWTPTNIGRAHIKGAEAEAKFKLFESLAWSANYTYINPVDKVTGEKIYTVPQQQLNSNLNFALFTKTSVCLEGRMVKNYVRPAEDEWEYAFMDGKITQGIDLGHGMKGEVFFGMKNIFDRKFSAVRTYDWTSTYHVGDYPMPPKEIYGGVAVQF
jgi:outer membrane cobalamin receptor